MSTSKYDNSASIGCVTATEKAPTTTGNVRFWLESKTRLKPFDIVRLVPPNENDGEPNENDGEFYVLIQEISEVSDETSPLTGFISSDFGQSNIKPRVKRVVTTYAEALVLYNTKGNEMPVPYGSKVHWPDPEGVRRALGIDDFKRKTPAGFITMSGPDNQPLEIPIDMDADYLIGPEGGHLNISGISGLATKTSYGMFLLTAIQQKQENDWPNEDEKASFVILNVKGSDLLRLDIPEEDIDTKTKKGWERCKLQAKPLENVTYFYPFADSSSSQVHVQTYLDDENVKDQFNKGIAYRYFYDIKTAIRQMRFLVEDIEDPTQTLTSCVDWVSTQRIASWGAYRGNLKDWRERSPDKKIQINSWRRFIRLTEQRIKNPIFTDKGKDAESLHQISLGDFLKHLQPGKVIVIDIAKLPDYLQSFVVSDIVNTIRNAKSGVADIYSEIEFDDDEQDNYERELGTVILFADELNKFAPKHHTQRSITRHLREISERGRSEGIIMFGAEQFRTGVEGVVTGNCGTQVIGRTTASESTRDPEITHLPKSQQQRVPFLQKGELLVQHPRFSAGTLKIRFPRNAYKTK